jgi:CcmD family protein
MPENASYMVAAYVATAVILGGYVFSLISRARAMANRGDAIDTVSRS